MTIQGGIDSNSIAHLITVLLGYSRRGGGEWICQVSTVLEFPAFILERNTAFFKPHCIFLKALVTDCLQFYHFWTFYFDLIITFNTWLQGLWSQVEKYFWSHKLQPMMQLFKKISLENWPTYCFSLITPHTLLLSLTTILPESVVTQLPACSPLGCQVRGRNSSNLSAPGDAVCISDHSTAITWPPEAVFSWGTLHWCGVGGSHL